jgi:Domain of unknown function (DUF4190)
VSDPGQTPYQQQPYPQQPYPQQPSGGFVAAPNHKDAVTSLVLGILSLVLCGFVTGIPAMILGRRAKREIQASGGALGGEGLATAGFVTGLVSTVIAGAAFVLVVGVFIFGGAVSSTFEQTCTSVGSGQQSDC